MYPLDSKNVALDSSPPVNINISSPHVNRFTPPTPIIKKRYRFNFDRRSRIVYPTWPYIIPSHASFLNYKYACASHTFVR